MDMKLSTQKNPQPNPLNQSVILVDADGVLLNWEYAFSIWMETHGFSKVPGSEFEYDIGKRYNIEHEQGRKLHEEHGYVFHCITSLSVDPSAGKLREMNLNKLFGDTAFEKVVCLATGADKDAALEPYKGSGCYWVEDKPENAEIGHQLGLRSILMEHGHNMYHYHSEIPVVKNWRQIYEIITS